MTDAELAKLRAKIRAVMAIEAGAGFSENYLAGRLTALRWVLSLLPPPPPKYEVDRRYGRDGWNVGIRKSTDEAKPLIAACFLDAHYPDAEQRAREECARLNRAARNEP
jgi:hypothetical protein